MKFEDMINTIQLGDSSEMLKFIPNESIDMILTSPPYDELRNYNNSLNWNFDVFKKIANELVRILKPSRNERIICLIEKQLKI